MKGAAALYRMPKAWAVAVARIKIMLLYSLVSSQAAFLPEWLKTYAMAKYMPAARLGRTERRSHLRRHSPTSPGLGFRKGVAASVATNSHKYGCERMRKCSGWPGIIRTVMGLSTKKMRCRGSRGVLIITAIRVSIIQGARAAISVKCRSSARSCSVSRERSMTGEPRSNRYPNSKTIMIAPARTPATGRMCRTALTFTPAQAPKPTITAGMKPLFSRGGPPANHRHAAATAKFVSGM